MIPTFRPWTHTADDSYMYQLSLVVATATVSLILSFTQNIVRAYFMFYPYEGYRSVTPLDAARVNRTIFHNHSVH